MNDTEGKWSDKKPGTKAVWGGEKEPVFEGVTQMPVVHGVTYAYQDMDEWYEVATGNKRGHIYSRNTNPTVQLFEEKVRILENAESATSFSTGMAAISNALFTLLSPGQRIVSIKDTYGGTSRIFLDDLPRFNVEVKLCDTTDHFALEEEIKKGCRLVYLESPTNPTVKVVDLRRIIEVARQAGAITVVDNTFATPLNQNPLDLGADLVLHSATKFLGGHSDAMGGVICGSKDLVEQIFHFREINGATLDSNSAYLLIRGMKTLELRVLRQNENALALARFLQGHSSVKKVHYPGLTSDPGYQIAKRQMRGPGGVFSFSLKGGFDVVKIMLENLQFAHKAAHLGGSETLVGPPKLTSHVETSTEERKQLGIPEGLIRCSVGIENIEDLIVDFDMALSSF